MPYVDSPPAAKGELYHQEAHTVYIPEDVRLSGKCTPEIIAEAVTYLHRDGLVVLDNAIDKAHLDTLNELLSQEAKELVKDPEHHFNFGKETKNMDQAPPPRKEYMFRDVWANPFGAGVLSAMLGPRPVVHYANGNTAMRSTGRQPVHSDCGWEHPIFPFAYVMNINLVDTSAENGATEVWLGSHHRSSLAEHNESADFELQMQIKPSLLQERMAFAPPIQPATKKGALVIRDLRLWHAGMPNRTDEPRVMLAFVVQPTWYCGRGRVLLPKSVKETVEGWSEDFQYAADWVDGEVDHKKVFSSDTSFQTGNEALLKLGSLMHRLPYQ